MRDPCRSRLALASCALALLLGLERARANDEAAREAITAADLKRSVETLASDDFAGREAGSRGGFQAAEWLASEVEKLGLEPAGDDGTYFQNFRRNARSLRNVIASLPARDDSKVADEVVVLGSHYDHLGKGTYAALDPVDGRGKIHHGADDNASGSAGTLALARAFAKGGRCARRIVFVWFDAEELGLWGSQRYVREPPFPLRKTVAMFNMDMIGRARGKLVLYGLGTGSNFPDADAVAKALPELAIDSHETMPPNSDHQTFYAKKIPVIALFTGLHKDYHRATDTADKIDAGSMERIVRLGYDLTRGIAERLERPRFAPAKPGGEAEAMADEILAMLGDDDLRRAFGDEEGFQKAFREGGIQRILSKIQGLRKATKPRFGVSIETREDGIAAKTVYPDSVAAKAGVHVGDTIVSLDGKETRSLEALQEAVRGAKGKVALVIERDGQKIELEALFDQGDKKDPAPPNPDKDKQDPGKRWL